MIDQERQLRIRRGEEPGIFPVSFSRIDRFMQCKLWYRLESVERLGRTRGDAGDLGIAVHEYARIWVEAGPVAAENAIPAILPLRRLGEFYELKDTVDRTLAATDLSDLFGLELTLHYEWPVQIYYRGEPIPNALGTCQYEARIDLLIIHADGAAEILDWKTGRKVPYELEQDVQLKSYALTVLRNFPQVWQVTCRQAQLRKDKVLSVTFNAAELEEFDSQIFKVWVDEMFREEEFSPSPGDQCSLCPHVLRCDAGQRLIPRFVMAGDEQLPVILPEDPSQRREFVAQLAEGLVHLKAQAERVEKIVRTHVQETDEPVVLPDGSSFDEHLHYTIDIDSEKFFDVLDAQGRFDWGWVNVDKRVLGSLLNPRGKKGYTPELEPYVEKSHYPKWGLKGPQEEE